MFKREPKTVYFRHFPAHGLRTVFSTVDAKVASAILGKMIVRDVYWETVQKMLAEHGLKAADVTPEAVPEDLPPELKQRSQRQMAFM